MIYLFKSFLIGGPVGMVELWFNSDTGQYEVLDAQQRLKTMDAIIKNKIRTPKNLVIDGIDCSEKHFCELEDSIRERCVKFQFLAVVSFITREEAVDRFIGINMGHPLSAQDKRSPQVSEFADFIRQTAFYPKPKFTFAKYDNASDKVQLKYFSFSHVGRTMDEILAYIFMIVKDYDLKGIQSYNQKLLDLLYIEMKDYPSHFKNEDKNAFEKILKNVDKLVQASNWNRKISKKKELMYILLILNHHLALGGQINQPELFIQKFHMVLTKCKRNKKLIHLINTKKV